MIVFADTSALIKLYIEEEGSERMRDLVNEKLVAVSMLAWAEAHATFARRVREGVLERAEHARLQEQFEHAWRGCIRVPLDGATLKSIPGLCSRHALRGGDAAQLASALLLHEQGLRSTFACCDVRLCTFARAEGLDVFDPTRS